MNLILIFIFFSIGWFISDIFNYLFLRYIKKDVAIYNVKYGFNWWHYYFTNKYKED